MPSTSIERQTLQLERSKVDLEREKLKVEVKKTWITAVSVAGGVLIAALSFLGSVYSQYRQSQTQFQLKAAELVIAAQSAQQAAATASALSALFPEQLPRDFASRFPQDLPAFGPDIIQAKVELLKLMEGKSPKLRAPIIELWCKLFREDTTFECPK
jgi:hypothetical protein